MADDDKPLPFTTADGGDLSRIADTVARQRKDGKKGPQLPASSIVKTGGLRQASVFAQGIERRVAAHPAFVLDAERGTGNIARLRFMVGVQSLIMVALSFFLYTTIAGQADKAIYAAMATDQSSRVLRPLPGPIFTQDAVLSWVATRATAIMNFGFHNVTQRLAANRQDFTERGWEMFVTAVEESSLRENIVAREQVITAAPMGAPVIVKQTILPENRRSWIIQMPMMVTIISGKQVQATRRILTVEVVSVLADENLSGLRIENWIER